jgi:hypothetical protein
VWKALTEIVGESDVVTVAFWITVFFGVQTFLIVVGLNYILNSDNAHITIIKHVGRCVMP